MGVLRAFGYPYGGNGHFDRFSGADFILIALRAKGVSMQYERH